MKLDGKKVAVVGLGVTGQSCVRFLQSQNALVTGFDTRLHLSLELGIPVFLGDLAEDVLSQFDLVLISPGLSTTMPAIQFAKAKGIEVIGDIELFARFNKSTLVGVTGSNGKSTVVSMLHDIFTKAGKRCAVGGNIGTPVLQLLDSELDIVVLELSSFQLETINQLPLKVAAVLNISEDHMDRYDSLADYAAAKARIYHDADICIANQEDELTQCDEKEFDYLLTTSERDSGFGLSSNPASITYDGEVYLQSGEMQVSGIHNLFNAQAAALIAKVTGIDDRYIKSALSDYQGLPHRCQKVARINKVDWINDSKATNVGATIAAISGLKPSLSGKLILLAGGDSKNADLAPLTPYMENDVEHLIVFGKDANKLAALKTSAKVVETMQQAVEVAANLAHSNDTVLLSPACASLDMFKNFEHRGQVFQASVEGLR